MADKNGYNINIQLNTPLPHSAAQNFHLVQVFLNSSLCLLHFTNYISNNENILFRSLVKNALHSNCHSFANAPKVFVRPRAITVQKKNSIRATKTFPKLCYITWHYRATKFFLFKYLYFVAL